MKSLDSGAESSGLSRDFVLFKHYYYIMCTLKDCFACRNSDRGEYLDTALNMNPDQIDNLASCLRGKDVRDRSI